MAVPSQNAMAVSIASLAKSAAAVRALRAELDQANVLWNGTPNWINLVVQSDLDAFKGLNGMTVQQLKDGVSALTGTILTDVNATDNALIIFAALASS